MPETNELMQAATGETAPQQIERQKAGAVVASMEFGPAGTRDRAEVRDRDFDAEAFAREYLKLSALASGGGQMVAGLVNAVPVVMDYAARLIDKDVTRAPNAPGVDAMLAPVQEPDARGRPPGHGQGLGQRRVRRLAGDQPDRADAADDRLGVSALFPPLRAVVLPGMGAQSAGGAYAEGDSSLAAVLAGGAEVVGEKASLGVFDRAQAALAKPPRPLQGQVLSSIGKSLPLRAGAVTGQGIAGAVEEAVTQIPAERVDRFAEGKNTDIPRRGGAGRRAGRLHGGPDGGAPRAAQLAFADGG